MGNPEQKILIIVKKTLIFYKIFRHSRCPHKYDIDNINLIIHSVKHREMLACTAFYNNVFLLSFC